MVKNEQLSIDKALPDAHDILGNYNQIDVDEFLTSDKEGKTPIEQLVGVKLVLEDFAERNSSIQAGGTFLSVAVRKIGNKKVVGFNTGSKPVVEAFKAIKEKEGLPARIEIEKKKSRSSNFSYYQVKGLGTTEA